jgi:hypothetical protein
MLDALLLSATGFAWVPLADHHNGVMTLRAPRRSISATPARDVVGDPP